jgi:hypothetical protein
MAKFRKIDINGEIWEWRPTNWVIYIRSLHRKLQSTTDYGELFKMSPDDVERAKRKKYFEGATPGIIRKYIEDNLIAKNNLLSVSITVPLLKKIFNSEVYAEYVGGTLTVGLKDTDWIQKPQGTKSDFLMFSVGKGRTQDEDCWIALNYLRWRKRGCHFEEAYRIVSKNARLKKHLTIALLKGE